MCVDRVCLLGRTRAVVWVVLDLVGVAMMRGVIRPDRARSVGLGRDRDSVVIGSGFRRLIW